jgi:DNA-binding NtrC family response regulator
MEQTPAKILVIDDETSVCVTCRRILEEDGYEVETVLSGVEGVDQVRSGDYDLVLVDLKMKDMSGLDVLEIVKRERPNLAVIIITGYASIKTSIEAIKKGAYNYVPKPFTPEELSLAVSKALNDRLVRFENRSLKKELSRLTTRMQLLGSSTEMQGLRATIRRIAPSDFTIAIYGESGTGKELVAHAIHENSQRAGKPFVEVDISALTPTLAESELFGHVKGAFTGASQNRQGHFTLADGGTLFLDEVSNISLEIQGKLLRVLETRSVRPVGSERKHGVNVRIVTATNQNLYQLVEQGKFREDLYYRLNVIPLTIPPLRERTDDIPLLAMHFLTESKRAFTTPVQGFTTEAMAKLIAHPWPGNVRELKNIIERLVSICEQPLIGVEHIPSEIIGTTAGLPDLETQPIPQNAQELKRLKKQLKEQVTSHIEQKFVLYALERSQWNVTRAAKLVSIQRPNFHALMRKHGIKGCNVTHDD